jgi:hypothetical protein
MTLGVEPRFWFAGHGRLVFAGRGRLVAVRR